MNRNDTSMLTYVAYVTLFSCISGMNRPTIHIMIGCTKCAVGIEWRILIDCGRVRTQRVKGRCFTSSSSSLGELAKQIARTKHWHVPHICTQISTPKTQLCTCSLQLINPRCFDIRRPAVHLAGGLSAMEKPCSWPSLPRQSRWGHPAGENRSVHGARMFEDELAMSLPQVTMKHDTVRTFHGFARWTTWLNDQIPTLWPSTQQKEWNMKRILLGALREVLHRFTCGLTIWPSLVFYRYNC